MTESSANIDRFNALAAHLFSVLYDSFPKPIDVESAVVAREARTKDSESEDLPEWERAAANTVSWLAEEGFVRYKSAAYGGFVGVRLSMKGLTVLGYTPVSIKSTGTAEPLIVRLKRAVGKGVEGAATDAVKDVIGQVFGLFVRYAISADNGPGVPV